MILLLLVAIIVLLVLVAVLWVVPTFSSSSTVSLTPSSQCVWALLDDDAVLSTDDLDVYAHLQRLLGPLVIANSKSDDDDGDDDTIDCFPATFQQQQALVWLMNHWLLPQDKLDLQSLATPTPSSFSSASSSNNNNEDPSLQVEWLVQAFVASLLSLHWDLHHHLPTSISGSAETVSTSLPLHVETLCSWAGVLCTGDGRWRSLQWNSDSDTDYILLQGSIPTELGLLTQLRLLDLSQQPGLTGSLPASLTRLSHLQALYLQDNVALTGTFPIFEAASKNDNILWPELTDVRIRHCPGIQQHGLSFLPTTSTGSGSAATVVSPRLQFLEWSQAVITTTTESEDTDDTASSSPLEEEEQQQRDDDPSITIDTTNIMFSSTLPSELGLWTNLQWVVLDGNGWVGTIPSTLSQWSKVQMLDLAYNYLEGTMPNELGQWTTLEWLSLQDSGLTGTLPSPWVELDWSYLEVGNTGTFGGLDLEPESIYSLMQQLSIDCKCGEEWPLMTDSEGSVAPLPEKCFCSKTLDG